MSGYTFHIQGLGSAIGVADMRKGRTAVRDDGVAMEPPPAAFGVGYYGNVYPDRASTLRYTMPQAAQLVDGQGVRYVCPRMSGAIFDQFKETMKYVASQKRMAQPDGLETHRAYLAKKADGPGHLLVTDRGSVNKVELHDALHNLCAFAAGKMNAAARRSLGECVNHVIRDITLAGCKHTVSRDAVADCDDDAPVEFVSSCFTTVINGDDAGKTSSVFVLGTYMTACFANHEDTYHTGDAVAVRVTPTGDDAAEVIAYHLCPVPMRVAGPGLETVVSLYHAHVVFAAVVAKTGDEKPTFVASPTDGPCDVRLVLNEEGTGFQVASVKHSPLELVVPAAPN